VSSTAEDWYAVRCIFRAGEAYEERITLWRAASLDDAIERAEAEARTYAAELLPDPDAYVGLAQAYALADPPGDGAEVFSLIRDSPLEPEAYLDRFFDTGDERQGRQ
jgi:hypothetical protein